MSEEGRDGDASEGGPRQYDDTPEPEAFDPDSLGPDVAVPEAPDPAESDVDPALQTRFWALVFVFNVAVLAVALGLMFAVFERDLRLGGQLVAVGLGLGGFGYYRYRQTRASLEDGSLTE